MTVQPLKNVEAPNRKGGGGYFDEAMKPGFPDFLTPIPLSTPANATPYITSYRRFARR